MISQIAAAAVGTIAFSLLFSVPRSYYPYCGLIGGVGWLIYCSLEGVLSAAEATFFATVGVILLSRFFAVWERCPVTLFLIPGIFPLVPGAGVYWTSYYIVTGKLDRSWIYIQRRYSYRSGGSGKRRIYHSCFNGKYKAHCRQCGDAELCAGRRKKDRNQRFEHSGSIGWI